jgi:hypothetical protein
MRPSRVIPFVLVLLGVIVIPRLAWWDRDPIEIELGVAGPSPAPGFSHPPEGLEWILNHIKAHPPGREGFGLFPGELGAAELRGLSAVYLTGGLAPSLGSPDNAPGGLESRIDDWLGADDARLLTGFASRGGAVVGEGGLLPAVGDAEALWRVEDCFRVRWTGWVGLSVEDIGDPSQTPAWILERVREAGDMTTVGGRAVILLKGDQIVVLRGDLEIEEEFHEIAWRESTKLLSGERITSSLPYRGWFDVVGAKGGCEVLADHKLHVTEWGAQKLAAVGLSETFPCFVGYRGAHASYYLAACFSSEGPSDVWVQVAGYPGLASTLASYVGGKRERAFWSFYYPLMSQVILEAARSWEESGS